MRATLFDQLGVENNPLSVTWHWQPSDDVDSEAFYEPVSGKGIAWRIPQQFKKWPDTSRPEGFIYAQTPDYDAADFKIVDPIPEITNDNTDVPQITASVGDGWELMRIKDVELVIWQQHFDVNGDARPYRINGARYPNAVAVARFLSVDGDARS